MHESSIFSTYISFSKLYPKSVIWLPAYPASFAHNFVSGMQSFISASPRMEWYCRFVIKNSDLDS